jgi:hypothetical protein
MIESKEITWRKIGGGSLRFIRGKIIKPNEIFSATPDEIPDSLRRYVIPMEQLPEPDPIIPVKSFVVQEKEPATYEMKKQNGGWYNVINTVSGKSINDKGLREKAARQLVEELNA